MNFLLYRFIFCFFQNSDLFKIPITKSQIPNNDQNSNIQFSKPVLVIDYSVIGICLVIGAWNLEFLYLVLRIYFIFGRVSTIRFSFSSVSIPSLSSKVSRSACIIIGWTKISSLIFFSIFILNRSKSVP